MLPPEALLADENARFGLKKFRIDSLADSIIELGGVQTPLKVNPLSEPGPNGETYRVREGHYRHAAVSKLNKSGAGLTLPCIVEESNADGVDRMKRQLAENLERNDMSPMDMGVAIKKLLDLGMAKVDIRQIFSRPGGRKGISMQPLSNSMLNIYTSFLEFPKPIQDKIHDGRLPVTAAMELYEKAWDEAGLDKEKANKILERAEADRQAEIDGEEKVENRFLEAQQKADANKVKAEQEAQALKMAQELAAKAAETVKAKLDQAAVAYAASNAVPKTDKEAKEKALEAFKAKEKEAKAAEKAQAEAEATAQKLKEKAEKNATLAADRAKKLADARKAAEKEAKTVSKEGIQRAAAKETGGYVALTGAQMRKMVVELQLPGPYPKVQRIAAALSRAFDGITTDSQLVSELGWITGERKEKPKHVKADPTPTAEAKTVTK
jgi:hypothetical protein